MADVGIPDDGDLELTEDTLELNEIILVGCLARKKGAAEYDGARVVKVGDVVEVRVLSVDEKRGKISLSMLT